MSYTIYPNKYSYHSPPMWLALCSVGVCSSIQLQLGCYIHTCKNKTHSLAPLQDLIPTLA